MTGNWKNRLVFALLFLLVCAAAGQCKAFYVKTTGSDLNTGVSWALAMKTVQGGIDAASGGDQVYVAGGTYIENIEMKSGVEVYGSYNPAKPSQRNWSTWPSVLDGNQAGTVVTFPSGVDHATKIDGFVIRNGKAKKGGGISCVDHSSPFIANNAIVWNSATDGGGGVFCTDNSEPVVINNIIAGNTATNYGGGFYCHDSDGSDLILANNTISFNSSNYGGGVYANHSLRVLVLNNTMVGNSGLVRGGGIYITGSNPRIINNIISQNSSGIYRYSGTPMLQANCVSGNRDLQYYGVTKGAGDIDTDPKLASVGFFNLHLQADSPCRNAGNNEILLSVPEFVDMDGQARIQGVRVDIGADESYGTTWAVAPKIVRVSTTGNNSNNGSSWALAKRTVQAGIDDLWLQGGEVWVAAGTYAENISLRPGVYVYGSFSGTESLRSARNYWPNRSLLDGRKANSVVAVTTGYKWSAIDGFDITNGLASHGGGILCSFDAAPTVANNRIYGNYTAAYGTGGGIACRGSASPTIVGNTISDNTAKYYGGGIGCLNSASPSISRNIISRNSANCGGGIYSDGLAALVKDNLVTGNIASTYGGGIDSHVNIAVLNNTIADNTAGKTAANKGSGIRISGGTAVLANNIIAFNTNNGIYKSSGVAQLLSNCVYANVSSNYAGLSAGAGDKEVDPMFAARASGNYRLTVGSKCINSGTDIYVASGDYDLDGAARIMKGRVDMGAYEMPESPTIKSFAPTSGGAGATVTISGTNFTNASAVKFNGVAAKSYKVVTATSITAVVPAAAKSGKISVTTPGGTATSAQDFTFIEAPTIKSFTPTSGAAGVTVTISGTNFTNASAVKFNGVAAKSYKVVTATSITAVVPVAAKSGKISVTTPGGVASSGQDFTFIAAPTI